MRPGSARAITGELLERLDQAAGGTPGRTPDPGVFAGRRLAPRGSAGRPGRVRRGPPSK